MTKLLTRSPIPITPDVRTSAAAPTARKRSAPALVRPAVPPPPQPPTVRQIRDRAYYIYLERCGGPGDAAHDWYQAERELWTDYRKALDAYMHNISPHA